MTSGGGASGFGPGLWVLDSEKLYQGEYWTNRYIIAAADMAAATSIAIGLTNIERSISFAPILHTKVRVSDGQPGTDVYQITNINLFGLLAMSTNTFLPLFNVVRVDFNTAGGGRPSRKYLRGCLGENNVTFNSIDAAHITTINTNYTQPLIDLVGFVDVDGQEIVSGGCHPFVAMRQLRRGSKRKETTTNTGTPL